jgi:hypothetical protein
MMRSVLVLMTVVSSISFASANQYSERQLKSAAMNDVARALPLVKYSGFTPSGAPCTIQVAKTPWVFGQSFQSILIDGSQSLYPTLPANIWGNQGFFQINISDNIRLTQYEWNANQLIVSTEFRNRMFPGVIFTADWRGTIAITKLPGGGVASVNIREESYDFSTGTTQTRDFVCGSGNPQ